MKKTLTIVAIVLLANISLVKFANAQIPEPVVPKPKCVAVPEYGLTCPDDTKKPTKTSTKGSSDIASKLNKSINDLLKLTGDYVGKIVKWIENGYVNLRINLDEIF